MNDNDWMPATKADWLVIIAVSIGGAAIWIAILAAVLWPFWS